MHPDQIKNLAMDISRAQEDAYNAGVAEGVRMTEEKYRPILQKMADACELALTLLPMLKGATNRTPEENATHETLWSALEAGKGI